MHIPIDSSTHYPAFLYLDSRATLPNSNPNALGAIFIMIFMMVFGMTRPGGESRPTVWEADTLTTKPTRHGQSIWESV